MRFREKRKEIEARLFDGDTAALMDVVSWIQSKGYSWYEPFSPAPAKGITMDPTTGFLGLSNNGETSFAEKGDWVYQDVDDVVKVGKAGTFEASYEEIPDTPNPAPTPPEPPTPQEDAQ